MLNPITYTEKTISDFLRYQVTTYPFADPQLHAQLRMLLNLEETRRSPLLQGPYITLSKSFRQGASVGQLAAEGILHPHLVNLAKFPMLFGHQEAAIRAIVEGRPTVVSTGTGSGKTEAFLYPIISRCLSLRDQDAPPGIVAVILYPMNALAEDQLDRLRELLAGTGVSFGMYIGKTPEHDDEAVGVRLPPGSSKADYQAKLSELYEKKQRQAVFPAEERVSRQAMRDNPPRILLTNVKQLELLLTRQRDVALFDGARLDFLVCDEAHTFSGAAGAETAVLIRRLRAYCGRRADETVCIATSATIIDPEKGQEAGRDFAARFFGVEREQVALVGEQHEPEQWAEKRGLPPPFPGDVAVHLSNVLAIVEAEDTVGQERAAMVLSALLGVRIHPAAWRSDLYRALSGNELLYQISGALLWPRELNNLLRDVSARAQREVTEAEVLLWLALGAAARYEDRPFLRPVVHAFVRGISGAVVTFPEGRDRPKLWLSAGDAVTDDGDYRLPVLSCTTCGQHYFEHALQDFVFTERTPTGGELTESGQQFWRPLQAALGGQRVLFFDRLIGREDEEAEDGGAADRHTQPLWLCAACGAVHSDQTVLCAQCGRSHSLVQLRAVRQREGGIGQLQRCLACGSNGGRGPGGAYREPIKSVRATTVSDVHVLAQNMIHHAERKRLLVFSDNRQDAAFQAGWMKDHARRFRLRALMYEKIQRGPMAVGDLTTHLDALLDADDDLSQALLPEVWSFRKQAEPVKHAEQRKYFLRIQVLRELVTGIRQRIGLEPWGRMETLYQGLRADHPFFQAWATTAGFSAEELFQGVAALLDNIRRAGILLDRDGGIFSHIWEEGSFEVQRGYLPLLQGVPRGLKLTRDPNDNRSRIQHWLSASGHQTVAVQAARAWGIPENDLVPFLEQLWELLTGELALLALAELTGWQKRPLPGTQGAYQIDADRLLMAKHRGLYRCQTCRRAQIRPMPRQRCPGWHCNGTLVYAEESPDDYDLMVLDQRFELLRPEEHSAQVPADKRERLERAFKSESSNWINTLVATPTLEMGVDIGALDAVLMRNVPPLPSNYWQRAGRAGRRFRMAVNLTYARNASHDRAYFEDPLKLLNGVITPPRINLRNELMIRKHVHATVLTTLSQMARDRRLPHTARDTIAQTLEACFPTYVKSYLFTEDGLLRDAPRDVRMLSNLIVQHQAVIMAQVQMVFAGWPEADAQAVAPELLSVQVGGMAEALTAVIARVWKRLQWALGQMRILDEVRKKKATLDSAEDALYDRCDRLVKKLKGVASRRRSENEGYDDTYTYAVLAAEGFLPGYGLGTGAVVGTAQVPQSQKAFMDDFDLSRPSAVALREYAPGNLIYANGNRFVPRIYHLEPDDPVLYQVDVPNEALVEIGKGADRVSSLSAQKLPVVAMSDVDMPHVSHISDEEEYRFQMPVTIIGHEQARHAGGRGFRWGARTLLARHAVHLRLVNVGAAQLTAQGRLGYPVSLVSGQSRSPLASDAELNNFRQAQQERYGRPVTDVGFSAEVVADALSLQDCANRTEAYSVAEALRIGAANVLDMEVEDLQLLCIGKSGQEQVDILIYDPMPGGSGLIEQMLEQWPTVVKAARTVVAMCPGACETACIDCLMTYRNASYHRYLNRFVAAEVLDDSGEELVFNHDIPARLPDEAGQMTELPVNVAEQKLHDMLLRAGFPEPLAQHTLDLGRPLGATIPDFYYGEDMLETDYFEGVCIYLDGLSKHIHGNRATQERDAGIRAWLQNSHYQVLAIPYTDLSDRGAMREHFFKLGRALLGKARARQISDSPTWFEPK